MFTKPSLSTEVTWYAVVAAPLALLTVFYTRRRSFKSPRDVPFETDKMDETMLEADAKYAEELQLQEAVLASQNSTRKSSLSSLLMRVMCEICLENRESCQMFKNSTCSHSFCYICVKHATTKIQAKNKTITCPGINCNSTLDSHKLRLIIPKPALIKWDKFLCESTIPKSQKLYCPFTNRSVLLINDGSFVWSIWSFLSSSATKVDCPGCRQSFCTVCRVPWHSQWSCKKFKKLKNYKDADAMALALAKKKKWMKCPSCYFFVEKVEGCGHITCRCKYDFCYACGGKWDNKHTGYRCRINRFVYGSRVIT